MENPEQTTPLKNQPVAAAEPVQADIAAETTERQTESLPESNKKASGKKSRGWIVMLILGIFGILGGGVCAVLPFLLPKEEVPDLVFPKIPSEVQAATNYSRLTGLPLAEGESATAPAYCIQVPNGTDGARPQSGLTKAGVIFEAIAEAGITRFAAIFQNPTQAVIGPIRSLRLYYLQWDTPFDCSIVHAGGADDAIAAVRSGGYKDLSENYSYMYRGGYSVRRWNNLFTTSADLGQFLYDYSYGDSNIQGFTRMTPNEARKNRVDNTVAEKLNITEPATGNTSTLTPKASNITFYFGGWDSFNVVYNYNASTNTYYRGYTNGTGHEVYECPAENLGEVNPEDTCSITQLNPSVVIGMVVAEQKAWDGYHEDITTIGSGTAYIFQNGLAIEGTWVKNSVAEQIKFYDAAGKEVALVPGQTIVSAIPNYGGVEY